MPEIRIFPYPHHPPPCARTGLACNPVDDKLCPSGSQIELCEYRAAGSEAAADRAMLHVTQEALQREQAENKRSRYDTILPGFFTGEGIRREIERNSELREELSDGNWGLLFSDLRGLKGVNERHGMETGHNLIRIAGRRLITEAGIRIRDVPVSVNRRQGITVPDIGFRDAGGDELQVLVRAVDLDEFESVMIRQHDRFSVMRAIEDSQKGLVPTILSFAGVHASELDPAMLASPADALKAAVVLADGRHLDRKNAQYDTMWALAFEAGIREKTRLERPNDHRGIADLFIEYCCPDYHANERQLLTTAPEVLFDI